MERTTRHASSLLVAAVVASALHACDGDNSVTGATVTTTSIATSSTTATGGQSSSSGGTGGGAGGAGAEGGGGAKDVNSGDHLYSRAIDNTFIWEIAAGTQGSLFVTGSADGPADFGNGPVPVSGELDLFVAKYDASDNLVFAKMLGDSGMQEGEAIAADGTGGLVVGGWSAGAIDFGGGPLAATSYGDAVVGRLDANGNEIWARRFAGAMGSEVRAIAIGANGNVVAVGTAWDGPIDCGGGPLQGFGDEDVFVVSLDASGNHLWSKRFGSADEQVANDVALDANGNVYIVGEFWGSIDFGGGTLTAGTGQTDIFIARLDVAGNHIWSKRFGDNFGQSAQRVVVNAGLVVMTGTQGGVTDYGGGPLTATLSDTFVASFNTGGAHLYSMVSGGTSSDSGRGLAIDGTGNLFLAGAFAGSIDFGGGPLTCAGDHDVFIAKLTPSHIWSHSFGGAQLDSADTLTADATQVAIAGSFSGSINFGGATLIATGDAWDDSFIARFAP